MDRPLFCDGEYGLDALYLLAFYTREQGLDCRAVDGYE